MLPPPKNAHTAAEAAHEAPGGAGGTLIAGHKRRCKVTQGPCDKCTHGARWNRRRYVSCWRWRRRIRARRGRGSVPPLAVFFFVFVVSRLSRVRFATALTLEAPSDASALCMRRSTSTQSLPPPPDTYAGYFTTRAPDALLPLLQYMFGALVDPDAGICLAIEGFRSVEVFSLLLFSLSKSFRAVEVLVGSDGRSLGENVCAFVIEGWGSGTRRYPRCCPSPRICIGMGVTRVYLGFCVYRGRRDAHFLFGMAGIWESEEFPEETPGIGFFIFSHLAALVTVLTFFLVLCRPPLPFAGCATGTDALASRIGAFAEVHAGLGGVPDSEKGKVLQSVIQALPPAEAVAPVEAMAGPMLQRLGAALGAVGAVEAARLATILQFEILARVVKGLMRTADPMAFDGDGGGAEADAVRAAREDPRTSALRSQRCLRTITNVLLKLLAALMSRWDERAVGEAEGEMREAGSGARG
ncbi:hypothetical protein B0H13DRAFT_2324461 [Mycena leptocephala]|nr:hypothetical protein B0H13DRAFT_2324461 [Mycena leptocephala]